MTTALKGKSHFLGSLLGFHSFGAFHLQLTNQLHQIAVEQVNSSQQIARITVRVGVRGLRRNKQIDRGGGHAGLDVLVEV